MTPKKNEEDVDYYQLMENIHGNLTDFFNFLLKDFRDKIYSIKIDKLNDMLIII